MSEAVEAPVSDGAQDTPANTSDRADLKAKWLLEIERYERKAQKFHRWGKRIIQRYTAEKKDAESTQSTYNILWSSMQTLKPALYAKDPSPEVERRFKDKDPVGRVASDVLERCAAYIINKQGFGDTMRHVVLSRLLPGRGVAWVRYEPHLRDAAVSGDEEVKQDGTELTQDQEVPQEVYWEEVKFDAVNWQDCGHTVARTWEEVDGVWRIVYMDKQECKKRFGAEAIKTLPFDQAPEGMDKEAEGLNILNKAKIYEIWDKKSKRAIWLNRSMATVLDVKDDPLGLEDFFPCPKFLQATVASESYIPTADYILWSDQAAELDRLTNRIQALTRALKVTGVYDASVPALQRMLNTGAENNLIAVPTWAAFAEKGGMKGAVELLPVESIAQIVLQLYEAREKVKTDLYEISGLSDLLRGSNDPSATATAEQIKANFASIRLKDMQREVQCFARDMIRIAGEIVANHFSLETIKQICGVKLLTNQEKQQVQMQQQMAQQYQQHAQAIQQQPGQPGQPPANPAMALGPPPPPVKPETLELMAQPSWDDVEQLLRDNAARSFRMDIETDSTIAQDEKQEQEQRLQFAEMAGKLLTSAVQVTQEVPELAGAVSETFMFVLRAFKVGRPTESAFQEAMDKLAAKAEHPQPKPPSPEEVKAQAAMQQIQAKAQADMQTEKMRAQADMQKQQAEVHAQQQIEQIKAEMAIEVQKASQAAQGQQIMQQNQIEAQKAQMQFQHEKELEGMRLQVAQQGKGHEASLAGMQAQHEQTLEQMKTEFERWKVQLENETKILIAQIGVEGSMRQAAMSASVAPKSTGDDDGPKQSAPAAPDLSGALTTAIEGFRESIKTLRNGAQIGNS